MPGNFYWMSGIVNFSLLGPGYFCIPVNSLDLCFRFQLSDLENSLIQLGYVGPEQQLNYPWLLPMTEERPFCVFHPVASELSGWLGGYEDTLAWLCVSSEHYSL